MPDVMHIEDEVWWLWGVNGEGFFEPSEHGLNVSGWSSTACYRGFQSTYQIHLDYLRLHWLEINLDKSTALPINGRSPRKRSEKDFPAWGNWIYPEVELPILFSGGLLLCRERVKKPPCGTGPELAWAVEHAQELVFENGRLMESHNRSRAMAEIREEVAANNGEIIITVPVDDGHQAVAYARYKSIEAKINSCFRFDYRNKL
jgi:hypothetical protein